MSRFMDVADVPEGTMFRWDEMLWLRVSMKDSPLASCLHSIYKEVVFVLEMDTATLTFFTPPEPVELIEE